MKSFPMGMIRDDNDATTENEYVSNEVATTNEEKFGCGATKASSQSKGDFMLGQSAKPLRDIQRPPKMKYVHSQLLVNQHTTLVIHKQIYDIVALLGHMLTKTMF